MWNYNVTQSSWTLLTDGVDQESRARGNTGIEPLRWRASGISRSKPYPTVWENAPLPHYKSSVCLLTGMEKQRAHNTLLGERGAVPQVLLFGGNEGIARNRFSGTLRSLKLESLGRIESWDLVDSDRRELCDWRLSVAAAPSGGGGANTAWVSSCGASGGLTASECKVSEILLRAWCLQAYQSFENLL